MESFFSETVAARLQYVTFPLELTGLLLALVEVRFPALAQKLTRQIERLSLPMRALESGPDRVESMMERSLNALLSRVLRTAFYALTLIFVGRLLYQLIDRGPALDWLAGALVSYLVSAVVMTIVVVIFTLMTFFIVIGGSDFARRFVAGRAIGTLGIMIAGLGLLGELYQLLVQLLS